MALLHAADPTSTQSFRVFTARVGQNGSSCGILIAPRRSARTNLTIDGRPNLGFCGNSLINARNFRKECHDATL